MQRLPRGGNTGSMTSAATAPDEVTVLAAASLQVSRFSGSLLLRSSQVKRFPKDRVKRQLWKEALRRRDFGSSDHSVVCSCHFEAEDFDRTGQTTRIREGAVPSVFVFTRPRGEAACGARRSRTSQKAAEEALQVQVHVTTEPTASDHQYALDPANVKKRLNEAQEKLKEMCGILRNAKDRERRHKKTVKSLLEDLKHKRELSEEVQQRLAEILLG